MATVSANPKLSELKTVFSGGTTLRDFNRGGGLVPDNDDNTGISTNKSALKLRDFVGATDTPATIFNGIGPMICISLSTPLIAQAQIYFDDSDGHIWIKEWQPTENPVLIDKGAWVKDGEDYGNVDVFISKQDHDNFDASPSGWSYDTWFDLNDTTRTWGHLGSGSLRQTFNTCKLRNRSDTSDESNTFSFHINVTQEGF